MPPRVCIITSSHPFADTRIFKKEGRTLVKAGYEVYELAPVDERRQQVDGITVIGFGKIKNRLLRAINLLPMLRSAWLLRADFCHVHEPELLLLSPVLKSLKPRTKFIYDVHENYDDAILSEEKTWIPRWLKPGLAWLINVFEKGLARLCDLVVAAGPDIEARFKDHRTISIRNYAPTGIIDKCLRNKKTENKNNSVCRIVYTGSITKTRGLIEILRALEAVNKKHRVELVVTGIYQDAEFKRQVEAEPGYRWMRFLGYLPNYEDVVSVAIEADMAAICFQPDPNLDKAVERSNKLFEYMAMGLPLVVSSLPAWAELVKKYRCGVVVDPMDPSDIARGITYLVEHPKERAAMGARGRNAVNYHYSWEVEGRRLIAAYQQLLAER